MVGLFAAPVVAVVNRLSGLTRLEWVYQHTRRTAGTDDFLDRALATLGVRLQFDPEQLARVPKAVRY